MKAAHGERKTARRAFMRQLSLLYGGYKNLQEVSNVIHR